MKFYICALSLNSKIQAIIDDFLQQGLNFEYIQPTLDKVSVFNEGDIIFWRGGMSNILNLKEFFLEITKKKVILLNYNFFVNPHIKYKYYQQQIVEKFLPQNSFLKNIPTFKVKNLKLLKDLISINHLKFPLIQKPNLGAKGENVEICQNLSEINFNEDNVYQSFIPNDGDYRIICIGGKVIDVIKRVGPENSHKNNLSTGGTASLDINPKTRNKLIQIANIINSIFELNFLGIDILESKTGDLYFLEINTLFQWDGFQKTTGKKITKEIADFIKAYSQRKSINSYQLVENYYHDNFDYLNDKTFHFLSRMYLFTKNPKFLERLSSFRLNSESFTQKAKNIMENPKDNSKVNYANLRLEYFEKHPNLRSIALVMFEYLFQKEIFGSNFSKEVFNLIDIEQLLEIKNNLLKDPRSIAVLGTYALNFLFNLEYLSQELNDKYQVDFNQLLKISEDYFQEETLTNENGLQIYYMTHVIINSSYFYSHDIQNKSEILIPFLKKTERLIQADYFNISLDHKFEFLVCCRLLNYSSSLEQIISSEADKSMSKIGNYLVDRLKPDGFKSLKNTLMCSEHRNVLFLMAFNK